MVNPLREEFSPSDEDALRQRQNDAALLERAQAGESASQAALYNRYMRFVYWICYGFLHNAQDAEDATQETWRRAFAGLSSASGASFPAWLARIATNLAIDYYRRQQRHPEDVLTDEKVIHDPDPGPEDWVLQNEARAEAQAELLPLLQGPAEISMRCSPCCCSSRGRWRRPYEKPILVSPPLPCPTKQ